MEFLRGIAASSANGNIVRISPGLFQPIAADDVAANVAYVAITAPRNGIVEIAGPERAPFNEFVARYLKIPHRRYAQDSSADTSWSRPTNERGDYDDQTRCIGSAMPHDRHGGGSGA
jgi:uncharacterized protein YbjT (DUF2867 family)